MPKKTRGQLKRGSSGSGTKCQGPVNAMLHACCGDSYLDNVSPKSSGTRTLPTLSVRCGFWRIENLSPTCGISCSMRRCGEEVGGILHSCRFDSRSMRHCCRCSVLCSTPYAKVTLSKNKGNEQLTNKIHQEEETSL